MSKNYYLETKDVEMVFDLGKRVIPISEKRIFECHLAQSCFNLKPLLEIHSYKSFKELKKILRNKNYSFEIIDENGVKYSVEDFIYIMEELNVKGKSRISPTAWSSEELFVDEDGFEFLDNDFF